MTQNSLNSENLKLLKAFLDADDNKYPMYDNERQFMGILKNLNTITIDDTVEKPKFVNQLVVFSKVIIQNANKIDTLLQQVFSNQNNLTKIEEKITELKNLLHHQLDHVEAFSQQPTTTGLFRTILIVQACMFLSRTFKRLQGYIKVHSSIYPEKKIMSVVKLDAQNTIEYVITFLESIDNLTSDACKNVCEESIIKEQLENIKAITIKVIYLLAKLKLNTYFIESTYRLTTDDNDTIYDNINILISNIKASQSQSGSYLKSSTSKSSTSWDTLFLPDAIEGQCDGMYKNIVSKLVVKTDEESKNVIEKLKSIHKQYPNENTYPPASRKKPLHNTMLPPYNGLYRYLKLVYVCVYLIMADTSVIPKTLVANSDKVLKSLKNFEKLLLEIIIGVADGKTST